jgi:hypothetical protein
VSLLQLIKGQYRSDLVADSRSDSRKVHSAAPVCGRRRE